MHPRAACMQRKQDSAQPCAKSPGDKAACGQPTVRPPVSPFSRNALRLASSLCACGVFPYTRGQALLPALFQTHAPLIGGIPRVESVVRQHRGCFHHVISPVNAAEDIQPAAPHRMVSRHTCTGVTGEGQTGITLDTSAVDMCLNLSIS